MLFLADWILLIQAEVLSKGLGANSLPIWKANAYGKKYGERFADYMLPNSERIFTATSRLHRIGFRGTLRRQPRLKSSPEKSQC
jgi:hypothetical protein